MSCVPPFVSRDAWATARVGWTLRTASRSIPTPHSATIPPLPRMEFVSACPFPGSFLIWQVRPGSWVLTVVCKATFALKPGESPLASMQDALAEDDRYCGDNPASCVHCPRDLVPAKPRSDVVLVGRAFSPDHALTRQLVARLAIGEIDKAITVNADRALRSDGSLVEGPPFTEMPLRYEFAAGGPGTHNPVGIQREARGADGSLRFPNLQRAGASTAWEPVGFGPIAPTWPERRNCLGGASASASYATLLASPMSDGVDLAFFNAAPRDQQLQAIDRRPTLLLECLHPDHPKLVTVLSTPVLRAMFEGRPTGPFPISLRADMLWIDTDRGLCTLTYRGQLPLESADERGRVLLSLERARLSSQVGLSPPDSESLPAPTVAPSMRTRGTDEFRVSDLHRMPPVLPFSPAHPASMGPSVPPVHDPSLVPRVPAQRDSSPALLEASPWTSARYNEPQPPLAPRVEASGQPLVSEPSFVNLNPGALGAGVLDASNAAAGAAPAILPPNPPAVRESATPLPSTPAREENPDVVAILWFDPESVPRIRKKPVWRPILEGLEHRPLDPDFEDPALALDPKSVEDRKEVFEILARAPRTPLEGLADILVQSVRKDGKFVPTLGLFSGEIEFPFDELAILRATMTTALPFSASDKFLKASVDAAKDFIGTPGLMSSPGVTEGLTKQIEEAFAQGRQGLPASYLATQRERVLLEQRQYQKRAVFGAPHLRALLRAGEATSASLRPAGNRAAQSGKLASAASGDLVPTYLPEAVATLLPMYPCFRTRILAEVLMPVDRYETHPAALRAVAVARVSLAPRT